LEQLKFVGLKEESAFEMMRQIKAFKSDGIQAVSLMIEEEAKINLLLGYFETKTAKQVLAAVVFVVVIASFGIKYLD